MRGILHVGSLRLGLSCLSKTVQDYLPNKACYPWWTAPPTHPHPHPPPHHTDRDRVTETETHTQKHIEKHSTRNVKKGKRGASKACWEQSLQNATEFVLCCPSTAGHGLQSPPYTPGSSTGESSFPCWEQLSAGESSCIRVGILCPLSRPVPVLCVLWQFLCVFIWVVLLC